MGSVIIGALSGAAIAAVITGYWTQKVEREKFTYSAVLRALEPEDLNQRIRRLRFIIDIGLVEDAKLRKSLERKLKSAPENPSELPQFQTREALVKAASSVIEEGEKFLDDQSNAAAHEAYLQWAEKHPKQALSVLPTTRTPDEYRRALNAQFRAKNVSTEEAKALLDDYNQLLESAVKKRLESSREQFERLKKSLETPE